MLQQKAEALNAIPQYCAKPRQITACDCRGRPKHLRIRGVPPAGARQGYVLARNYREVPERPWSKYAPWSEYTPWSEYCPTDQDTKIMTP